MYFDIPAPLTALIDSGIAFVYSFEPYVAPTVVLGKFQEVNAWKGMVIDSMLKLSYLALGDTLTLLATRYSPRLCGQLCASARRNDWL